MLNGLRPVVPANVWRLLDRSPKLCKDASLSGVERPSGQLLGVRTMSRSMTGISCTNFERFPLSLMGNSGSEASLSERAESIEVVRLRLLSKDIVVDAMDSHSRSWSAALSTLNGSDKWRAKRNVGGKDALLRESLLLRIESSATLRNVFFSKTSAISCEPTTRRVLVLVIETAIVDDLGSVRQNRKESGSVFLWWGLSRVR